MGKDKKKNSKNGRVSGSVIMAQAGLKQGVYWLSPEDMSNLKEAASINGQSVMSLVQHLIRTGSQKMIREHRSKPAE